VRSAVGTTRAWEKLALTAAMALFVLSTLQAIAFYGAYLGTPFFDWQFYRAAVERWLAGEPIYPGGVISSIGSEAGSSFAYPPASVPLFLPFSPWPVGAWAWTLLLGVALLSGLWMIVRTTWPARPLPPMALATVGAALFPPISEGMGVGNVNILTAGLLGVVWAGIQPSGIAGVMAVVKVFPLALSAPFGVRAIALAGLVGATVCLVTLPLVGVDSWTTYISAIGRVEPVCFVPDLANYSISCYVSPIGGLVVAAVALGVAVVARRTMIGWTAVVVAIMAPASEMHLHYFGLAYVLVWIVTAEWLKLRRS
jgi:hypothetical protein